MSRTCIICDGAAGSGEHVFPASLGGRRTNKGIYCSEHDGGYSGLVTELAGQLDIFNSMLGVRPDHSNDIKSILVVDKNSGQEIRLSARKGAFTAPRIVSQSEVEDRTILNMSFPDRKAIDTWADAKRAEGWTVDTPQRGKSTTYLMDTIHLGRNFGGPYGLAAVAYIAQTFLAQAFPALARSECLKHFKDYTQVLAKEIHEARRDEAFHSSWADASPVWWDFDPQPNSTPNSFEFGHRVTVGVDAEDGLVYGRVSFFSVLHFSMIFGVASGPQETKAVTTDIDPLAEHPPNDIIATETVDAVCRVTRPTSETEGLRNAIQGNNPEQIFSGLLQRMEDYSVDKCAKEMHAELAGANGLGRSELEALISSILEKRVQRVWNLTKCVVERFRKSPGAAPLKAHWPKLDALIEHDPTCPNGLTPVATAVLELSKTALLKEMTKDYGEGNLTEQRLGELIGKGPGLFVVGEAVLNMFIAAVVPLR